MGIVIWDERMLQYFKREIVGWIDKEKFLFLALFSNNYTFFNIIVQVRI